MPPIKHKLSSSRAFERNTPDKFKLNRSEWKEDGTVYHRWQTETLQSSLYLSLSLWRLHTSNNHESEYELFISSKEQNVTGNSITNWGWWKQELVPQTQDTSSASIGGLGGANFYLDLSNYRPSPSDAPTSPLTRLKQGSEHPKLPSDPFQLQTVFTGGGFLLDWDEPLSGFSFHPHFTPYQTGGRRYGEILSWQWYLEKKNRKIGKFCR